MSLVVDASVVVAALIDGGPVGAWAEDMVFSGDVAAPHLMPTEVANILRRASLREHISDDVASLAHRDLLDLRVTLYPYEAIAERSWQLRGNLTAYDASYVALAEAIDAKVATLDRRIARAAGPRCMVLLPPAKD